MAYASSFSIFNSILRETTEKGTFQLFPSLPKELRLQIWEEAVPRERLIRVHLSIREGSLDDQPPRYLKKNDLGKPISGPRYKATAEGHRLNSKFLRVNREARDVTLAFYRIHLPFFLWSPGTNRVEATTLYLNPEHDILHLGADAPVKETLVDFFWDMKAYDPKGVGIVKLGLDLEGLCTHDLQYLKRSDLLLIRQRNILIDTLSQLRELWFIYVESGRARPSQMSGEGFTRISSSVFCNGRTNLSTYDDLTTSPGVVPITSNVSSFYRIGNDPRQRVETGLSRLYMGKTDPREIIWRWKRLLRTWDIHHEPEQVKYRLLVGQRPVCNRTKWRIGTVEEAMGFVTAKDGKSNGADLPMAGKTGCEEEAHREQSVAVGYWLFPVEAVGRIGEGERLMDMDFRSCRLLDMRDHPPELLLSSIG
ncbi:hypothetical protein SLS53_006192 [Cytospora paraplurivora]|uniref:2EXR domain-containing protein n=1 Tax=Cytospora paraplurivora TaxID=2898453 RepID=A0AAN9U6D1_9PEZI